MDTRLRNNFYDRLQRQYRSINLRNLRYKSAHCLKMRFYSSRKPFFQFLILDRPNREIM